jgi:hypothetical protein
VVVLIQAIVLVWFYRQNPAEQRTMPSAPPSSLATLSVDQLTVGKMKAQSLDCPRISATILTVDDLTTRAASIHDCKADAATINNLSGRITFADYLSVRSEITVGDTPHDAVAISQTGITLQGPAESRMVLQADPTRSFSLYDEDGRLRLVIGQAALTTPGIGEQTMTAESSITAFDQDGKVMPHPITSSLRR